MPLDGLEPLTRSHAPAVPDLDGVAVWSLQLDLDAAALARCAAVLSPDERFRAGRYRRPEDRARFIAGRGQLRHLLGRCIDSDPAAIRFVRSSYGKPSLAAGQCNSSLYFNASGSEALALVALRCGADVGVDVEAIRPIADFEMLSRRLLSQDEQSDLSALPASMSGLRFLEYWVRKEAVAKSLGAGLAEGLNRFNLSPWPAAGEFRLEVRHDGDALSQWVAPLSLPDAGYLGAIASSRPLGTISIRSWSEPAAG